MYINAKHKKANTTKVRLNDPVDEMAAIAACRSGLQKAVWMRQAVEHYLVEQGFEVPGYEHTKHQQEG